MKQSIKRGVGVAALAATGVAMAAGVANAAVLDGPNPLSTDNNGIGNGNQVVAPIQVPVNICGNAVAVLGVAGAGCDGGSVAHQEDGMLGDMLSTGNQGIGNGNQVQAPVQVPVNVCGNSVAALVGAAGAGCDGGAVAQPEDGGLSDMVSTGNNGVLNGNQVQAPIQVPVDVSGNAVGVAGVAGAGSAGGSSAHLDEAGYADTGSANVAGVNGTDLVGGLAGGLLSGVQR